MKNIIFFILVAYSCVFTVLSSVSAAEQSNNPTAVHCPECGNEINVGEVLTQQFEARYRAKEASVAQQEKILQQKMSDIQQQIDEKVNFQMAEKEVSIAQQEKILQQKMSDIQQQIDERVNSQMAEKEATLRQSLKLEVESDYSKEMAALKEANVFSEKQLLQLRSANFYTFIAVSAVAVLIVLVIGFVLSHLANRRKENLQKENEELANKVHQAEKTAKKLSDENQSQDDEIRRQKEDLRKARISLDEEQEKQKEATAKAIREAVKEEREKHEEQSRKEAEQLREQLHKKIDEEKSEELKVLQEELQKKSNEVKEMNKQKAEISKLQREKEEMEDKLRTDMQIKFDEQLKFEREKLQQQASERQKREQEGLEKARAEIKKQTESDFELKLREKEILLSEARQQAEHHQRIAEDTKRALERGSQELQGEALELTVEDFLRRTFPSDDIVEVRKGQKGADIVMRVRTNTGKEAGVIVFECKRTQDFGGEWIEKIKNDLHRVDTEDSTVPKVPVIITVSMPKDNKEFHNRGGVWICPHTNFKGLALVLRNSLIQINDTKLSQQGIETKMSFLYNYITSPDFKVRMESIANSFRKIKQYINKQKDDNEKSWKKQEAELDQAMSHAYSIGGNVMSIATVQLFDAPEDEQDALPAIKTVRALEHDA